MKNKKLIISIICIFVVLIIGTITTLLLVNNSSNVDLNKISSFEYYSGSSSVADKFSGTRNEGSIDIEFINFDSGSQNSQEFTVFTDDFIDLLKTTKTESCKKHTYEYQCGENDGCSYSSFSVSFENEDKVCYQINSEIAEYFNDYSEIYTEDNEDKEATVDWTNLEITLNGKKYKYPFKVSDFINNGWTAQSTEFEEILNKTIDENFIPNDDNYVYVGYNYVGLKQDDLIAYVYFDTSVMNTKVSEAKVIYFDIESLNKNNKNTLNFYGVTFGTEKAEIEELFGKKNYEVVDYNSDDFYYYHYYHQTTGNQVKFYLDKKNNVVYQISIGLFK